MTETNSNTYKWDRRISFYVTFYFIASACNMAIKNILPIPESLWGVSSMLWGLGILYFMFKSFKEVLRRNSGLFFNSYLLFGVIYVLSIVLTTLRGEPLNSLFRDSMFLNFAWWIPVGVFSCSVIDKNILKETLFRGSFIISAVLLLYFYLGRITVSLEDANMYSMTFGFAFILPIILHVSRLFEKFNIWLLIFVFIEVLTLLIFANRGVVLSLVFYIMYKLFMFSKKSVVSFTLVLVLAVGGVIIASSNFLSSLNSILDAYDMQSRTLLMLADDSISDNSGRSEIWAICYDMIMDKPIFGWGLGGEYYHIARAMGASGANASAFTPHNGLIQAFVNFGVLGGFIVLIIFIRPLFGLKKIKDEATKELILITGSAALIPCLVSSDGLFYKPELAIYLYLFYQYGKILVSTKDLDD